MRVPLLADPRRTPLLTPVVVPIAGLASRCVAMCQKVQALQVAVATPHAVVLVHARDDALLQRAAAHLHAAMHTLVRDAYAKYRAVTWDHYNICSTVCQIDKNTLRAVAQGKV